MQITLSYDLRKHIIVHRLKLVFAVCLLRGLRLALLLKLLLTAIVLVLSLVAKVSLVARVSCIAAVAHKKYLFNIIITSYQNY